MMIRGVLLVALVGLACVTFGPTGSHGQEARPWGAQLQHRSSSAHHGHHQAGRYAHRHPARHHHAGHHGHRRSHKIVALDELIKRKHPAQLLGRQFIRNQLLAQTGPNKFLRLSGKEERDVNGTIAMNKVSLVHCPLFHLQLTFNPCPCSLRN
jgi:hypothetical protein